MENLLALVRQLREETLVLSLWQAGRELFHSNVLAYLLESPAYQKSLLGYLWGDDTCEAFHVRALREQGGLDLLVVMLPKADVPARTPETATYWNWLAEHLQQPQPNQPMRARLLVIENKFKSLPDEAQLQGYSEELHDGTYPIVRKPAWYADSVNGADDAGIERVVDQRLPYLAADCRKVILTPGGGKPITVKITQEYRAETGNRQRSRVAKIQLEDVWHSKSWQEISERLLALPDLRTHLEAQFVLSYARLLRTATDLHRGIEVHCTGTSSFDTLDALRTATESVRLADFVDKWRYAFLASALRNALKTLGWQSDQSVRNARGLELHFQPSAERKDLIAVVDTFFSRGMGGVDVYVLSDSAGFGLALQLQGSRLKIMFAMSGGDSDTQRQSVLRAMTALMIRGGQVASLPFHVGIAADELGTYSQKVRIGHVRADTSEISLKVVDGRLLYAGIRMWERVPTMGPPRPWANLSCTELAERMALLAHELVTNFDLIREALGKQLVQI